MKDDWAWVLIYIPICLYLNECKAGIVNTLNFIYIPICLYLNADVEPVAVLIWNIYIPICLYLNALPVPLPSTAVEPDLHSNMSLFKYNNMMMPPDLSIIYIPICLYLNVVPLVFWIVITGSFTFQYVSI